MINVPKREDLLKAKKSKNDEFYTQYTDIQKEINAYLEYNPNVFNGKTILLNFLHKILKDLGLKN